MSDDFAPAQQANDENEPTPGTLPTERAVQEAPDGTVTIDDTGEAAPSDAPPAFPDQPAEARGGEPLDHA